MLFKLNVVSFARVTQMFHVFVISLHLFHVAALFLNCLLDFLAYDFLEVVDVAASIVQSLFVVFFFLFKQQYSVKICDNGAR